MIHRLRRHPWKTAAILLTAAALIGLAIANRDELDRESVIAYGKSLPPLLFIAAFALLPLAGFPISILLVLTGIRFGFDWGMLIATTGVFFHNFAAYHLTHGWFREPLRHRLARHGYRLPDIRPGHRIWFTALFAAIHGPPYAAKLYLLALTDIPFRIYFWVGAPVYAVFCILPVGAGSAAVDVDPFWISVIVAAAALLLLAGWWLQRHFGRTVHGSDRG